MAAEFTGLENSLTGVKAGDFLVLFTDRGDALAGFVRELRTKEVLLSHESPYNKNDNTCNYCTTGDRFVDLARFNRHTVLGLRNFPKADATGGVPVDASSGVEYIVMNGMIANIRVGDVLVLTAKNDDQVGGYVGAIHPGEVTLSHASPFNRVDHVSGYITCGDRRYHLSCFETYAIAYPDSPEAPNHARDPKSKGTVQLV